MDPFDCFFDAVCNPIAKERFVKTTFSKPLRTLILEKQHCPTNIFELIFDESTRKNILWLAKKRTKKNDVSSIDDKTTALKAAHSVR